MKARVILTAIFFLLTLGYVVWHLWRIVPAGWPGKLSVAALFVLWFLAFVAGIGFSERFSIGTATVLYEVGAPWLIAFLYLFIFFVVADIATVFRLIPKELLKDSIAGSVFASALVTVLLVAGNTHYRHKYREELTIRTEKTLERPLTLVLASDLHIGYHNRRSELARWVDLINAENPDLVLFGGDIIDRSIRAVEKGGFADEFRRLSAPACAVPGNHEYYGDLAMAQRFYDEAGITMLRDGQLDFAGIKVIGRDDRTNEDRKPVTELAGNDTNAFILLLDHQPFHLEEAEQAGIDFQFSGHTHRGQIWPASLVTDLIYEKSWGHHSRGKTRYYISSGLGLWGPKVRIGSRSEYLVLHLVN
ncbi:MAG: metallophosphoesterase [Bacteroidales bacterium]|nr:metallophosphoesterase [Bacteroidales bacterium]